MSDQHADGDRARQIVGGDAPTQSQNRSVRRGFWNWAKLFLAPAVLVSVVAGVVAYIDRIPLVEFSKTEPRHSKRGDPGHLQYAATRWSLHLTSGSDVRITKIQIVSSSEKSFKIEDRCGLDPFPEPTKFNKSNLIAIANSSASYYECILVWNVVDKSITQKKPLKVMELKMGSTNGTNLHKLPPGGNFISNSERRLGRMQLKISYCTKGGLYCSEICGPYQPYCAKR